MLFVLVGARGAGKTTLLTHLQRDGVDVLQPSTTRQPRFSGESDYDFVSTWDGPLYAWEIQVGNYTYGMRKTELEKAKDKLCLTVFEPLNLQSFDKVRRLIGTDTITVGLQTIRDVTEQHRRVNSDPSRIMDEPSVPMTVRHRLIGSLPLRAEVTASDGYARIER